MRGMRLVEVRGLPAWGKVILFGSLALSAFALSGAYAGWKDPTLTWRGARNPEFYEKVNLVGMPLMMSVIALLAWWLVLNLGWVGLVYGGRRGDVVVVGTRLGLLGCWWRRIECVSPTAVEFKTVAPSPGTGVRPLTAHLVIVSSGGRELRIRSFAPATPESRVRMREWLEENGVEATVVESSYVGSVRV